MSDELFQMPDSPLPTLEHARRMLERAIESEKSANIAYDAADEYEMSPRDYSELEQAAVDAEYNREDWQSTVARLEREAMGK
jgi:hypothetical protein